eukprot:CAMPEP_0118995486 /NCGR_PEP_ID=MMETSP1173-20130426/58549_1 /TAXON_ID=1034831 /ORGANISM="Rhizochromulina marina cf, Strain CCMP1243" /LENGTH=61 /DNA_ID=CAMNT_0006946825 /DNA_START=307 /DNA_END=488 /DNA_ORIENTATION=+
MTVTKLGEEAQFRLPWGHHSKGERDADKASVSMRRDGGICELRDSMVPLLLAVVPHDDCRV